MKKISYILIPAIVILSGCTHYYYAPNMVNMPLLREKNDMRISGGRSNGAAFTGADFQFAYAVSPKIGIMANGFFGSKSGEYDYDGNRQSGKGSYGEVGIGYYKPFSPKKLFIFELYGGAGLGETNHSYGNSATAKVGVTKFFLQPSVGYISKKGGFEFAFGTRLAGANLKVKEELNFTHDGSPNYYDGLESVQQHPFSLLWEPSVRIGLGPKGFKFYFSYTNSVNLTNNTLSQERYNASLGLIIAVNTRKKKS